MKLFLPYRSETITVLGIRHDNVVILQVVLVCKNDWVSFGLNQTDFVSMETAEGTHSHLIINLWKTGKMKRKDIILI